MFSSSIGSRNTTAAFFPVSEAMAKLTLENEDLKAGLFEFLESDEGNIFLRDLVDENIVLNFEKEKLGV